MSGQYSMKKTKILVVDDHPLVRFGVINQLKSYDEFVVVGEAEDGEDAIAKTKALGPDLVIMDIFMPGISGIEATKLLKKKYPSTRVLILTGFENEDYVYQIIRSGAGGYVLKSVEKEQLIEAVRAVMKGEKFFSPGISKLIVENFIRKAEGQKNPAPFRRRNSDKAGKRNSYPCCGRADKSANCRETVYQRTNGRYPSHEHHAKTEYPRCRKPCPLCHRQRPRTIKRMTPTGINEMFTTINITLSQYSFNNYGLNR